MCNTQVLLVILMSIILSQVFSDESTTPGSLDENSQVEILNELGLRLMTKYVEYNNSTNIAISPAGITVLLSMALLGSIGSTHDEIADLLGFPRDILVSRMHHESLGGLLRSLSGSSSKTVLADAVFVDRGSRLRDIYGQFVSRVYGAEAHFVDFSDGGAARQAINDWVKEHTAAAIESFLADNLPSSTRVLLLNALYFRAQWAQPFYPQYTTKMVFQTPDKKVTTDFMLNAGQFDYVSSKEDGIHMVALPYKDNETTMYALKPRFPKRSNITDVLNNINYVKIDELISNMSKENCIIRFPKMNIESDLNLERYIKLEGVTSMFRPGKANFALMVEGIEEKANNSEMDLISRINAVADKTEELNNLLNKLPNPGIYVDSIIQKVKINIDEFGTEAVAATGGVLARTAEMFYADSPFLIFIRNERTKLVTFNAIIFDPTDL